MNITIPFITAALALLLGAGVAMAGEHMTPQSWDEFTQPTETQLRERLTELQYEVTQNDATERAFDNPYWDNKQAGIYVDIISGEPLFSSTHKFDSGTGWPSFTQPIEPGLLIENDDSILFYTFIEVRSKRAGSHLGHILEDAPKELGGIRYCINSAALRFVPQEKMESEGYGAFLSIFES